LNYTRKPLDCIGTGLVVEPNHGAPEARGGRASPAPRWTAWRRPGLAMVLVTALATGMPAQGQAIDEHAQAVQLARDGQYQEAVTRLQALALASDDLGVRFDLIVVLGWAGRHADAVTAWQTIPPERSIPPYVKQELIRSLTETGNDDQAAQLARAWVNMSPRDPAALIATGQVAERRGLRFDALRAYGLAQALSPERSDLHATLSRLLADLGGTHGAVEQALNPSLRDRARRAATKLRWATQIPPADPADRDRRLSAVIAELDTLLAAARSEPSPDGALIAQLLGDRAVALNAGERWQAALEDVNALRTASGLVPTYVRMAEASSLLGLRRPVEALAAYRAVLEQTPENVEARWGLFYAQVETNDWLGAYQTVDAIAPEPGLRIGQAAEPQGNPDWLYARIVSAQVRSWADEPAAAWDRLIDLADKAPAHAQLRAALASVAAARGWPRRADEEIRIAESLDNDSRPIQIEAAESAFRRGRWTEVESRLSQLADRYPNDSSVARLKREVALRERYELRIDIGTRDEGETTLSAPGDSLHASMRLYGPTWREAWRIFAASDRMASSAPGVRASARQRMGMGSQYRTADTIIEAALWSNTGPLEKSAASIDARRVLSDQLEVSASFSSFAADTPIRAVANGISASAAQWGIGYTWSELASISLRHKTYHFSDDNRRHSTDLSFSQRVFTAPDFKVSLQPSLNASSNSQTSGPYFSPRRDQSLSLAAILERVVWRSYERSLIDRLTIGAGRYRQVGFQPGSIADATYEQTYQYNATLEFNYGLGVNRRLYDGESEFARLIYLQMVSRF